MKILYDHQAFDMQHYGGVSNCFVQLIANMPEEVEYDISLLECSNVHLRDSGLTNTIPAHLLPENFILNRYFWGQGRLFGWFSKSFPSRTPVGRNRLYSISKIKHGEFDVFHPTYFDPYFLPYLNDKPFVLTVHDMIPELFYSKNDFQVKVKPMLCQKAAHIVTVSEKTKNDLTEILHVPDEKVTVIYHGSPNHNSELSPRPLITGRYILFVGQRAKYKSFLPMLNSLLPVLKRYQDIKVVCAGPSFLKHEKKSILKAGLVNRVIHMHVNDRELRNLYAHALCFIYPSIYEGFGIPILEAYSANCPVLLNYASCFPEIAQDAAIYFHMDANSSDLDQIMDSFLRMNEKEKESLLFKQKKRLSFFSWKESALKLANVYSSIL